MVWLFYVLITGKLFIAALYGDEVYGAVIIENSPKSKFMERVVRAGCIRFSFITAYGCNGRRRQSLRVHFYCVRARPVARTERCASHCLCSRIY